MHVYLKKQTEKFKMVTSKLPLKSTSNRFVSFMAILWQLLVGILFSLTPESWRYKDVKGQTVLITGAGSGIGQLMAVKFAQLGCKVILWDVNEEGMKETVKMIKEKRLDADMVYSYKVNLAKRDEIYATAQQVQAERGVVDILINNAGVVSGSYFLDTPDELNQLTFDVNVLSHFTTIKSFLPGMINQKRGHIVTIASVAGNIGGPRMVDYCASKFANVGMEMALRQELAQANLNSYIKTTIVKPYLITTGMFSGCEAFLFSPLSPEYVASRVVSGVLAETEVVVIPGAIRIIFFLIVTIPEKCLTPLFDFAGVRDMVANFKGRNDLSANNAQ